MGNLFAWISLCFCGGVFGALVNSVLVWMAGSYGWTAAMGVAIAPEWTLPWLYQRLVWGGLWGLVFTPRFMPNSCLWRGLLVSVGPTLAQLLIVFPNQLGKGYWGLDLGNLTPVVVVVANAVWGCAAAAWIMGGDDNRHAYGRRLR